MKARESGASHGDRWLAIVLSVLVHACAVGVLAWGWWRFHTHKPAVQQLAIEATVVTAAPATAAPAPVSSAPVPAAPVPVPETPAKPVPEPARVDQAAAEQERAEQRQREERAMREREAQEQAAATRRAEQEGQARKVKEAADRAARARAEDKAKREAELQSQLATEERVNAARGSRAEAEWLALIRDKVTRNWIRPPSARAGVNCEVHVTQVPGGVVTGVQIVSCNGDDAVRASIEAAVYRASPLPMPSNADLFDRNLRFDFHPDE
ncbi:MAG TPA: cell envelope integrity protein TolA [Steroidobacteraceae bacterium]|nr:cell envelope integrity protein TolA [Steroidobacteraceae bacterium]